MERYFILDKNRNVVEIYNWKEHREWHSENATLSIVGLNHLSDGHQLVTRFLRIPFSPEKGLFFETALFDITGKFEFCFEATVTTEYKTYQEAIAGHLKILKTLIS